MSHWDPHHPIHHVTSLLNSPAFIAMAREIIGCPSVTKIDAQASNYQPGNFLTRHIDESERRAAYTIGFSRKWEPDWGGLLNVRGREQRRLTRVPAAFQHAHRV